MGVGCTDWAQAAWQAVRKGWGACAGCERLRQERDRQRQELSGLRGDRNSWKREQAKAREGRERAREELGRLRQERERREREADRLRSQYRKLKEMQFGRRSERKRCRKRGGVGPAGESEGVGSLFISAKFGRRVGERRACFSVRE